MTEHTIIRDMWRTHRETVTYELIIKQNGKEYKFTDSEEVDISTLTMHIEIKRKVLIELEYFFNEMIVGVFSHLPDSVKIAIMKDPSSLVECFDPDCVKLSFSDDQRSCLVMTKFKMGAKREYEIGVVCTRQDIHHLYQNSLKDTVKFFDKARELTKEVDRTNQDLILSTESLNKLTVKYDELKKERDELQETVTKLLCDISNYELVKGTTETND